MQRRGTDRWCQKRVNKSEALGEKPITSTQDINQDEEIIALKKQLDEIRAYKENKKSNKNFRKIEMNS